MKRLHITAAALALTAQAGLAVAADSYVIDPNHTYPSFETPHIAGISMWRGKFNKTTGKITLDRKAKTGTLDIAIDMSSINSGHAKMDEHLKSPDFFNVAKNPTATYKADKIKFSGDTPSEVEGNLTLNGITKAVPLKIKSFKCVPHPMTKVELCGADVYGEINRTDFGIKYGVEMMGSPSVKLAIQVEALKEGGQPAPKS